MVQNIIEPFNEDVIKVTIKDKPILYCSRNEDTIKQVFEALRQYAQQERKIREVRIRIYERVSKRRLRRYFEIWYNYSKTMQKKSECVIKEAIISNEKKIERFVNAIAEKQKEIETVQKKEKCQKPSTETKSAPQQSNKTQNSKQKRTASASSKMKEFPVTLAHNRLEAQRKIIEEQRVKLAKQKKFIEQMKLNEINKEAKKTTTKTIKVAKQVFNQCNQSTKRSLIHLMKEQGCRDKSLIEIPRINNPPAFLIRMEVRAEARKERMKQTSEIRQRKREEQKKKEEIRRQQAEEKEKREQMQALKEAQRLRREQEERRLKELEKTRASQFLADQFYRKRLFHRYIIKPLNILVQQGNQRLKWANQHYEQTLSLKVFSAWKKEWIDQYNYKLQLARKMYRYNLLWGAFADWRNLALDIKQKYQVAQDFYDTKLQGKYFKAWYFFYDEIRVIVYQKELKAKKFSERRSKRIYFDIWKRYVVIADDIRARESRREEWRRLIRNFVPRTSKLNNR